MKAAAALLIFALALRAQAPVRVEYACPPEDLESFGLACSAEDPCSVFLEISSVQALGARLFLAGNLHTAATTLYGIVLMSEDAGKTWTEPHPRLRSASLDQIQFLDFEHGWISGQIVEPLPKDPFVLLTTDGGRTWRLSPLFEESRFGSIAQFWFDSPNTGELVFQGGVARYELFETMTGGGNWSPKETSTKPMRLSKAPSKTDASWRVRADASTKTYKIERGAVGNAETVASFLIRIGDCK